MGSMKDTIKHYAARVAIAATRESSRFLPKPKVLTAQDIDAVKMAFESQWHHFGIVDNWYTEDDLRWKVWDDLAKAKTEEARVMDGDKRLIQWNGEFQYV